MAKVTEAFAAPLNDQRSDASQDTQPVSPLAAIAAEEIAEIEAVATAIEQQEQAALDAEMAALTEGWQEAMRSAADLVTSAAPDLAAVWKADRMDAIGAALARCDAKYGWGGAAVVIKHPLVHLGVASFPVAVGTVAWLKVKKAEAVAAAERARYGQVADAPSKATQAAAAPAASEPQSKAGKPERPVANLGPAMDAALARDSMTA